MGWHSTQCFSTVIVANVWSQQSIDALIVHTATNMNIGGLI